MAYTAIEDPTEYFNTKLYTGTGSSLANTGIGFQPDWVWIKGRSGATEHVLTDSVRGVTKELNSNDSTVEETVAQGLTAFGSDGFTVGTDGSYNTSSATYASWNWKAGTSFTNDASGTGIGSIDSAGSASDTAGFSIVSYTGTGSAGTIKHGLSSTPKMMIFKNRSTDKGWSVYHNSLGATKFIFMNETNLAETSSTMFNNTAPTSSLFTVGTDLATNVSGNNYIAYCFAEKQGYSKFGSYTGNGNADGPFTYTGFKPAFVMEKRSDGTSNWGIFDSGRNPNNYVSKGILANASDVEDTSPFIDFLSNGFKQRSSSTNRNASGGTYIYMAFAENPFVTSTGVPATAR